MERSRGKRHGAIGKRWGHRCALGCGWAQMGSPRASPGSRQQRGRSRRGFAGRYHRSQQYGQVLELRMVSER